MTSSKEGKPSLLKSILGFGCTFGLGFIIMVPIFQQKPLEPRPLPAVAVADAVPEITCRHLTYMDRDLLPSERRMLQAKGALSVSWNARSGSVTICGSFSK